MAEDKSRLEALERRVTDLEGSILFSEKTISERLAALENRIAVMENRQGKSDSILISIQIEVSKVQRGIYALMNKMGVPIE